MWSNMMVLQILSSIVKEYLAVIAFMVWYSIYVGATAIAFANFSMYTSL